MSPRAVAAFLMPNGKPIAVAKVFLVTLVYDNKEFYFKN